MIKKYFQEIKTAPLQKIVGFAAGNNAGLRESSGRYVIILNPDIAMVENAIENLLHFFENHPNAGIVGPRLIHPDGTFQYSCFRFPNFFIPLYRRTALGKLQFGKISIEKYLMKEWDHATPKKVDWLFGAFLMIRRDALEQVGLFDDRFFLYYEDLDLCRRFWEKGREVWYNPNTELIHYHQRLSGQKFGILSIFNRATRIHIVSSIKYFAKYFGARPPKIPEK